MASLLSQVKTEWKKSNFLTEQAGGREAFNYAFNDTSNGTCVLYTSEACGIFTDEGTEDFWSASDLKDFIKSEELGNSFPTQYVGQWNEITDKYDASEGVFNEETVERFGLTEDDVKDILERMVDLGQFSEEQDIAQG